MAGKNRFSKAELLKYRPSGVQLLLLLILLVYVAICCKYVPKGQLNADEGFYCLAAQKAIHGQIPYKDFAYSQTPALPYMNGLAMKIIGFGFTEQRIVNATWGLLTIILLFYIGSYLANPWVGLAAGWLTTTSPYWVHFECMGKTYAAAGVFLAIAALTVAAPWTYRKKFILFSLAAVLSIGCRLTVLPVVFVLWLALLFQGQNIKQKIIATILPIALGLVSFLPFLLADSQNFIFWNLTYHLGSSVNRRGWISIKEHLWMAPALLPVIAIAIATLPAKFKRLTAAHIATLFSVLIGITVNLSLKSTYGENSTSYIPLLAVGATAIAAKWQSAQKLSFVVLLLPLAVFAGPMPIINDFLPDALIKTAQFVQKNSSADDSILTSFPIIAIEAKRKVPQGLEMGKFALTSEMSEEKAKHLHLVTPAVLREMAHSCEPAAIVINSVPSPWNFSWSIPSLQPVNEQQMQLFFNKVDRNYHVKFERYPFAVFLPKTSVRQN